MSPTLEKAKHWIITTVVAMLGGGAAAGFTAAMDPSKYDIRHDFGSGKLWPFVFMGWGLTFAGILIHSPLGQKVIAITKQSKAQLEQTQKDLDQAKADLRGDKPDVSR
jgi:hypothetical protein